MSWALRYSPHVGYVPPDRLLFRAHAGADNRAEHIRFAAREGMAGVLFPWACESPPAEREAVRAALLETGLECSCIVSTPFAKLREPLWTAPGAEVSEALVGYVGRALDVAQDLNSSSLAVLLIGTEPGAEAADKARAADRLRSAADTAAERGMVLVVEPIPGMLLRTFAEGAEYVRALNHPAIRLIFDTGHVTTTGEPLMASYVEAYDDVALLQIADMPGRVESGAGTLDLASVLAHAIRRGYRGLVDLEHDWAEPGLESERRGLQRLAELDAAAQRIAEGALAAEA